MASGDFVDIEAGDTLAILKNESIIMSEIFEFNVKYEGDFVKDLNTCDSNLTTDNNAPKQETLIKPQKQEREKKLGHRRVHTDGGISYKKIHSSKIMDSIQLGIQRSVGSLSEKPERDVLMADFMTVESASFTGEESLVYPNQTNEFIFKTYSPVAFRYFRDLFGIKPGHFVDSFCNSPLVELPNPGASGSVFYLTENDEFITKTVQRREANFLQTLLPGYYLNLNQNPCTLLPKYFGLYCYKCDSTNVRMIVMNNVLPSSIKIHQKYDLKGSTYKRKSSTFELQKSSPTYKDLDFLTHHPEGIFLDAEEYKTLIKTIQRDCRVLESFQIIDYSLLVGVHNVDLAKREKGDIDKKEEEVSEEEIINNPSGDGEFINPHKDLFKIVSENQPNVSENASKLANDESTSSSNNKVDFDNKCITSGIPARQANGEKLLLFIGIIDILQSYRLQKKLEHAWKSILHDGNAVSVHNPGFYSQRFQDFMSKTVFKATALPKNNRKCGSKLKPLDKK